MSKTLIGSGGIAFGYGSAAFGVSSSYALEPVGPPGVVVPPPYLSFDVAGPNKTLFQTSGNNITGGTLSTGQTLLWISDGSVGPVTLVDAPELGAGVKAVRMGYLGYLEVQSLLSEAFYGGNSRTLFFLFRAPVGVRRELASTNPVPVNRQAFDFVSLDNNAHTDLGIGVHMIGNDGILPSLPAATTSIWRPAFVTYDGTVGMGPSGPGTQYIRDNTSSSEKYMGQLITGSTSRAKPRLGMGVQALDAFVPYDAACIRWYEGALSLEQQDAVLTDVATTYNNIFSF